MAARGVPKHVRDGSCPTSSVCLPSDLHLALWNPYQALDFDAPALMTYGFAPPALDAVNAWLAGDIEALGVCPVPGFER